MKRVDTKQIRVGNLLIGGQDKCVIQSMTNTTTHDIEATVKQINELTALGCELVRVAILDMKDAIAIKHIIPLITIPLCADIHYDYKLALEAIKNGCKKIRINPGNIGSIDKVKEIVLLAMEFHVAIRIGINCGSLPDKYRKTPEDMLSVMDNYVKHFEEWGFKDIIISLKANDLAATIKVYELASERYSYPLHIGVTEAGTNYGGLIKSSIALGHLLLLGIGDTIRVSLSSEPSNEIQAAKEILKNVGLYKSYTLISCPTCGRTQFNMLPIAIAIEEFLSSLDKEVSVAVMGCGVNGPGEAKDCDIGIAGGIGEGLLFKKGKVIRKIKEQDILAELKKEILSLF